MLLVLLVAGVVGISTQLILNRYVVKQIDNQLSTDLRSDPVEIGRPARPAASGAAGAAATTEGAFLAICSANNPSKVGPQPRYQENLVAIIDQNSVLATVFNRQTGCQAVPDDARELLRQITASSSPKTVVLGSLGPYRVQSTRMASGATQVVGLPLSAGVGVLNQLSRTMMLVIGGGLLVAAIASYLLIGRTLRPLDRVAATARQVSGVRLDSGKVNLPIRVPEADTSPFTEIGQVGAALNQLLGHVGQALDARERSEQQVRQFVADASHELRTPLAAIRGYAELATRPFADPETINHALRRVDSESVRMSHLVNDLLLLARLDAGRPMEQSTVDLTSLVVDVVSDARVAGPEHRWQLDLPATPVITVGDSAGLHQVLANLLSNAATHTPPGCTVTVTLAADGNHCAAGTLAAATLTVSDDGPGIAPEVLPDLFHRFVRSGTARSRAAGSTGLGLAIVAAVVRAHGGTVAVNTRPGSTDFTVHLPAQIELSAP
ncbi:sensor histidine kinase [Nakamurella antarctica]|uniref:histidine kinase n=1 Tax=Nakamurella antarctica TaxID=1902245 RepID=A0A3G8ZN98_9ACTN|nr:HAMP domain-containing sensor histidine kinase [Nakamurella antarctica]AZI58779.1 sensor histidine kinase [Nakamurella antarctica]